MDSKLNVEVEFEGALSAALDRIHAATGENYVVIVKLLVAVALVGRAGGMVA